MNYATRKLLQQMWNNCKKKVVSPKRPTGKPTEVWTKSEKSKLKIV